MINISKPNITQDQIDNVVKTMKSGMIAGGPAVEQFEDMFSEYVGVNFAMATNSGTSALHCALEAVDVRGYEVITTPFTFVASANAILMAGGRPIFIDIGDDYNIDPRLIEDAITEKTKAILAVNLYGKPANYIKINEIARKHNLKVIEDAAQSVGAKYKDIYSGNLADIGCFSFYATKNLMTGEGGMVTTTNIEYANFIKSFRNHGQGERYEYKMLGFNYRMTDIAASIGIEQMNRIEEINARRVEIANMYEYYLPDKMIKPKVEDGHVFHQYTIRVPNRDAVINRLKINNIGYGVYYPKPLHKFEYFKSKAICPKAEEYAGEVLSIPVHPLLTKDEVYFIANTIKGA
jgi:dTDP-4-amino-4,6-dideoxygalactose transaminase